MSVCVRSIIAAAKESNTEKYRETTELKRIQIWTNQKYCSYSQGEPPNDKKESGYSESQYPNRDKRNIR
jgi:hypothetical protein